MDPSFVSSSPTGPIPVRIWPKRVNNQQTLLSKGATVKALACYSLHFSALSEAAGSCGPPCRSFRINGGSDRILPNRVREGLPTIQTRFRNDSIQARQAKNEILSGSRSNGGTANPGGGHSHSRYSRLLRYGG